MTARPVDPELIAEAHRVVAEHGGNVSAAVIDPRQTENPMAAIQCFADLETAIRYRDAL